MSFVTASLQPIEEETPSPEEVACIICFDSTAPCYHCAICSAMWCDACGEKMYDTARDHEDPEVDLVCPQCRGSIAEMQLATRLKRLVRTLGCSDEVARVLVAYENLLTEVVHLCECEPDGQPYFMWPPKDVARIMSRDTICEVVSMKQGKEAGTRLTRMLRGGDYGSAFELGLVGYAAALRHEARVSPVSVIEELGAQLFELAGSGPTNPHSRTPVHLQRCGQLCPVVRRVLEAEQAAQRALAGATESRAFGAKRAAGSASGDGAAGGKRGSRNTRRRR